MTILAKTAAGRGVAKLNSRRTASARAAIAAAIGAVALTLPAGAATFTWNRNAGTWNWNDATNWSPSTHYPGDTAAATTDVAQIALVGTTGGPLVINYSGITAASLGTLTLSTSAALTGDSVQLNVNGPLTALGPVTITSSSSTVGRVTMNVNAPTTTGDVTLNNGNLTVTAAVMSASTVGNTAADTSQIKVNGGTLNTTGNVNLMSADPSALFQVTGGGAVNIGGSLTNGGNFLNIDVTGGTLHIAGNLTEGTGGYRLEGAGDVIVDGLLNGANGGAQSVIFNTTGSVSLAGISIPRNLSGSTPVPGGMGVKIQQGIVQTGTFRMSTNNSNSMAELSGGTLLVTGATFNFSEQFNNRLSEFFVDGGVLVGSNAAGMTIVNMVSSTATQQSPAIFNISSGTVTLEKLTMAGTEASTAALPGTNHGTLTMSGGELYLGSGGLVALSVLPVANTSFGADYGISLGGGTLGAKDDWTTSGSMGLTGNFTVKAADISNVAHNIGLTGALTGVGTLTKTGGGVLTLGANNTYTRTTILAGTLQVGAGGTTGSLGSGAVTNSGALVFNRTNAVLVTNVITGNGSVAQNGSNMLTLQGANNYSGNTTVAVGGSITFGGSVVHAVGAISGSNVEVDTLTTVGSGAVSVSALNVKGTLNLRAAAGANTSKIAGSFVIAGSPGAWNGQINLTDNSLVVQAPVAKALTMGTIANQINSGSAGNWTGKGIISSLLAGDTTHTLAVINNADFPLQTMWSGQGVDADSIIVARELLGDISLDGAANGNDFDIWLANRNLATFAYDLGDITRDGVVDNLDFHMWYAADPNANADLAARGYTLDQDGNPILVAPEPTSAAALGVLVGQWLIRRRRRRAD